MLLKNTASFDMARFLLMLDGRHTDMEHIIKFHKMWPVLFNTIRIHEKHIKENKINRLRLKRQQLATKIINTQQSNEADDIKNRKISQMLSYMRDINSALHQLTR